MLRAAREGESKRGAVSKQSLNKCCARKHKQKQLARRASNISSKQHCFLIRPKTTTTAGWIFVAWIASLVRPVQVQSLSACVKRLAGVFGQLTASTRRRASLFLPTPATTTVCTAFRLLVCAEWSSSRVVDGLPRRAFVCACAEMLVCASVPSSLARALLLVCEQTKQQTSKHEETRAHKRQGKDSEKARKRNRHLLVCLTRILIIHGLKPTHVQQAPRYCASAHEWIASFG